MAQHGSIAGNVALGSSVRVTNRHRFSYPGYAELLVGEAHDDVINSNAKRRNPYPTVLEFIKRKLRLDARQVAAFSSWAPSDWIVEHEAGTITSNAGFDRYERADPAVDLINQLQSRALTPWDDARHDAFTFRLVMTHLRSSRPRALYIEFDETDDWAHDGRYDRVLDALHEIDGYLRELWSFLQRDAAYRDRTAIVITADHGRGNTPADCANLVAMSHRTLVPLQDPSLLPSIARPLPYPPFWICSLSAKCSGYTTHRLRRIRTKDLS